MPESHDNIMVGMASIPEREASMLAAVASLARQADVIYVSLNGYDHVPVGLPENVVATIRPGNVGDAEKFAEVKDWDGIVVTCDDDILYPADYVATLVDGLDRHGRETIVGFHGGTTSGWTGAHTAATEKRIRCLGALTQDDPDVNVLGTGALAYDSRQVPIWRDLFRHQNMADVHLACHAHTFGIPMVALAHDAGWLGNLEPAGGATIYESNRAGDGSVRDTRANRKAELDRIDWAASPRRPRVRVSVATCERTELLYDLLLDLEREAATVDLEVAIYEDPADADYGLHRAFVAERGWEWHTMGSRCGKSGYWMVVDQQHRDASMSAADWFVTLPDDIRLERHAVAQAISTFERLDDPSTLTLWRLMDHEDTGSWTGMLPVDRGDAFESYFADGCFLHRRELLEFFDGGFPQPRRRRPRRVRHGERLAGMRDDAVTSTSSGVGRAMSIALHRAGKRMYRVARTLAVPVPNAPSVMNPDVTDRRYPGVAL